MRFLRRHRAYPRQHQKKQRVYQINEGITEQMLYDWIDKPWIQDFYASVETNNKGRTNTAKDQMSDGNPRE